MSMIYKAVGTSKQNVHQRLDREMKQGEEKQQLRGIVRQVRMDHPSMGARALYTKISPKTMGRDRFYAWYHAEGFTIRPMKNWRRTTDSSGVVRFKNLVEGYELSGVNQVWVSDITYYDLHDKFYYLTLVMDLFSRRIKGYNVSKGLRTEETTLPALTMATRYLKPHQKPIIHSDGGGQYYSKSFLNFTKGKLTNSMGEAAYENPHAERLNRTIKNSYLRHYHPQTFQDLQIQLKRAVEMYNDDKPHDALRGLTPRQFETRIEIQN